MEHRMTDSPFLMSTQTLTMAGCQAAMTAAVDRAREDGISVTVAILDAGGHLLHLIRMDGVHIGTVDVSIAKARCAVEFKRPTKAFQDSYAQGATALPVLKAIPFEGGVPVIIDGHLAGAIGASGAAPHQDGAVATAAVNAILGQRT
jgi:glc operon protein GlcG